ncbi:hypothetical protein BDFB_013725 [Asbolus verrucosus]|uniref:Uncharacterized protein n=1 Tax=Asbolus verrucosus TaxID=1661398 RepID=A0A482W6K3_ASBVE|nr:hypothetical protein BDFB_013725 [Asbolus verrucosus]
MLNITLANEMRYLGFPVLHTYPPLKLCEIIWVAELVSAASPDYFR